MTSNLKSIHHPNEYSLADDIRTPPQEQWGVRYNNDHTTVMSAAEYAALCDNLLFERTQLYPFVGDSRDYFVLANAAKAIRTVPGLVCEIGLRAGGGAKAIMDQLIRDRLPRTFISIDPYGGIPYQGTDKELVDEPEYTNRMRNETLEKMYRFTNEHPNVNFLYFPLTDTEFFDKYNDGVPIYADGGMDTHDEYALIHFDGPHSTDCVMDEVDFFCRKRYDVNYVRIKVGTMFVFDDVTHFYDHDKIEQEIFKHGFELIEKTDVKASYRKMK